MLYIVIVASELAFWALLVGGLYVRYAHDRPRLSARCSWPRPPPTSSCWSSPGSTWRAAPRHRARTSSPRWPWRTPSSTPATSSGSPTASSCGASVARSPSGVQPPKAVRERAGWYRHARMWAVGVPLLGAFYVLAGRRPRAGGGRRDLDRDPGRSTSSCRSRTRCGIEERQLRLGREARVRPRRAVRWRVLTAICPVEGATRPPKRPASSLPYPAGVDVRPAASVTSRSRRATARPGNRSSRHFHAPAERPGVFMRASDPSPSTSCTCAIATRAGEAWARRISDQCGSRSRTPAASIACSTSSRTSAGSDENQPTHRVVVVRPRVHDGVLAVVHRRVHVPRVARPEAELEHDHARVAERGAQPLDRLGDDPEVLGDHRQLPELARRGVERRPPRSPPPASAPGVRGRRAAPPSRRRSRGSGRFARGRRARRCGAAARSTSDSRAAAAPASRTAGCPTAGPCRCRRPAACPPPRRRGTAPGGCGGRPSRARRRSARRRSAARRAPPHTSAAPPTRGRTAPGRRPSRGATSRRSSTRCARGSRARHREARAPAGRPAAPATPRTPRRTCTASRAGPAAPAAASATTSAPPRPASRRSGRPRARAARRAARWGAVGRRWTWSRT